ncbi:hypothetical protein JTM21_39070, partial [Pseudomonas aeruginosa]|nr:hypothetical protein [Pseudomonas aeruginosa]
MHPSLPDLQLLRFGQFTFDAGNLISKYAQLPVKTQRFSSRIVRSDDFDIPSREPPHSRYELRM